MTLRAEPLVGRAVELASLEEALVEVDRGRPVAIEVAGEPGIGKTRLLRELSGRAEARGHLVLSGSATELEHDLPFSVFLDALDDYLGGLRPERLAALDAEIHAALAHVFPSLSVLVGDREVALGHERYRSYRAVRELLGRLAAPNALVLLLDDMHWADSASVELLGTLFRRPAPSVLIALAVRPRQVTDRLSALLERAHRAELLTRLEIGPLAPDEARELLGEGVDATRAARVYEECGGNPFYLEQLARSLEREGGDVSAPASSVAFVEVPPAVAASLAEELSLLSGSSRLALEGAAVAGDPFELELAAAAAAISEAAAVDAVDELLHVDLIRTTDVPRRFRFRHPLVRRAVYETTPGGWRLGAHERCAETLAARGVPATARAHHIERSARQGDTAAIAVLHTAGEDAARLAPESAARWFSAALRLLPHTAPVEDRVELLLARAGALASAGHFTESHDALLETVAIVPAQSAALRTTVATACAGVERQLGRYEQAHERLARSLRSLPEPASVESVELLIELTLNEFYRSRYEAMHDWAERAVSDATMLGDAPLIAAALAMPALASAMTGPTDQARSNRADAAALVDELSDDELSLRPDAAAWLAAAELYLDLYTEADAHASRAAVLARASGRGDPLFRLYPILPRIYYVRGKLAEAADLLDGAIEAGRLLGSPPALAGNLFNRSAVALAVGDLDVGLATAEEAVELTRQLDGGFVPAWAAVRLAQVLLETGNPHRAVELLLGRTGGEELTLIPGGWRAYCLELLTQSFLALGRLREAERAALTARGVAEAVQLPLATAWADRAAAAVALYAGDAVCAVELALASADAAAEVGAPIESGLSRTLAARALAQAGHAEQAVAELERARGAFEVCGALRYRDRTERELGKLGRRPHRRTRRSTTDGVGLETLTERELQVARLAVDGRTNPQIATELFLSKKTVETHMRHVFQKMGVTSRVALARAVERADQAARDRSR